MCGQEWVECVLDIHVKLKINYNDYRTGIRLQFNNHSLIIKLEYT